MKSKKGQNHTCQWSRGRGGGTYGREGGSPATISGEQVATKAGIDHAAGGAQERLTPRIEYSFKESGRKKNNPQSVGGRVIDRKADCLHQANVRRGRRKKPDARKNEPLSRQNGTIVKKLGQQGQK